MSCGVRIHAGQSVLYWDRSLQMWSAPQPLLLQCPHQAVGWWFLLLLLAPVDLFLAFGHSCGHHWGACDGCYADAFQILAQLWCFCPLTIQSQLETVGVRREWLPGEPETASALLMFSSLLNLVAVCVSWVFKHRIYTACILFITIPFGPNFRLWSHPIVHSFNQRYRACTKKTLWLEDHLRTRNHSDADKSPLESGLREQCKTLQRLPTVRKRLVIYTRSSPSYPNQRQGERTNVMHHLGNRLRLTCTVHWERAILLTLLLFLGSLWNVRPLQPRPSFNCQL